MISIVLPAYNEEGGIGGTIEALTASLDRAGIEGYEVLVVDDGSTDKTADRAARLGARVVTNLHNLGYGRSLKRGIQEASFDTIVITDADGAYPVEEIPGMLKEFDRGFDLLIGSRSNLDEHDRPVKRLMRRFLRRLVEVIAGRHVPDINSGLRIFRRQAVVPYFPLLCDTFSFTTSQTLAFMLDGRFVHFYPLHYAEREGTSKVRLFRDAARTLQYVVQTVLYSQPIRIFILASALLLAGSILSLGLSFATHLNVFYFMAIGGTLVAILVFGLGLLADLLKQILRHQNQQTLPASVPMPKPSVVTLSETKRTAVPETDRLRDRA
jgi:glycosyltransferase involved in cell wall biosynthesis